MERGVARILSILKENSGDDIQLKNFFKEIVIYELEGHGWYTDDYKKIIAKYVREGGGQYED